MISFDRQGRHFKFRAAGLCIHDGYVLLTKADQDRYWILPGGRVELGEDTRTTLRREFVEETGHEAEIGDLLWIVENFFYLGETDYHELAFVYAASPTDPAILNNAWAHQTTDGDARIDLRWFELADIGRVCFQPAFLKPLLANPPTNPRHLIIHE